MATKKTTKKTAAKKAATKKPSGDTATRGRLIMSHAAWDALDKKAKDGESWSATVERLLTA